MRLTQIKLSGFKSFVDPTHFALPGRLVGVVGPNGCGKSNIIDAARWVLGESKASELRGESMQDVIFNGSAQRKPAGRASVELVFDNTPGGEDNPQGRPVSGPWGQYHEIAVKRVLTRDGTSTYLINNQAVRRRDIQDIFLGTGLGPRAYAIIGQGMISRIIEARPDELRVFLEEAAGISKYKERRRETENRLADTRENLTRVEDILRELNANLDRLERQAVVAQEYRELETEVDEKQKLLWLLRANEAEALAARHRQDAEQAQLALDARTADLRRVELDLERVRSAQQEAEHAVHAAQGSYYEAASAVSAIESEIRVVVESRNRLQAQLAQLAAQREHWSREIDRLAEADRATGQALTKASEAIRTTAEALAAHATALPDSEALARSSSEQVESLRARIERHPARARGREHASAQRGPPPRIDRERGRRASTQEHKRLDVPDPRASRRPGRRSDDARGEPGREEGAARHGRGGAARPAGGAQGRPPGARSRESRERADRCAPRGAEDLQERVQANGKLQPWLDQPRARPTAAAVATAAGAVGLGDRGRGGPARTHRRARGRPARPGEGVLRRCAAGQAVDLFGTHRGRRPMRHRRRTTRRCRRSSTASSCATRRCAPCSASGCAACSSPTSEADALDRRHALPAGGTFVLRSGPSGRAQQPAAACGRFRAGGHARAPARDRRPHQAGARPDVR